MLLHLMEALRQISYRSINEFCDDIGRFPEALHQDTHLEFSDIPRQRDITPGQNSEGNGLTFSFVCVFS